MDKHHILSVHDIHKSYQLKHEKKIHAVRGISFSLSPGECLAIVGESGCGKTTLARVIAGMEEPDEGQVLFLGKEIKTLKRQEIKAVRMNMQYIFQNPSEAFSPRMKIGAFLCEPFLNYRLKNRREAREAARELLRKVDLHESCMDQYPHELSGGQLQRVVIARALALNPALVICDEITSALDVSVQEQIMELLFCLRDEGNTALIFICHDLGLVQKYTDRVAVMYLGKLVEIMESRQMGKRAFHPYTKALIQSVFTLKQDRNEPLFLLSGEPACPVRVEDLCSFSKRCQYTESICLQEEPRLKPVGEKHFAACHRV